MEVNKIRFVNQSLQALPTFLYIANRPQGLPDKVVVWIRRDGGIVPGSEGFSDKERSDKQLRI